MMLEFRSDCSKVKLFGIVAEHNTVRISHRNAGDREIASGRVERNSGNGIFFPARGSAQKCRHLCGDEDRFSHVDADACYKTV